MIKVRSPYYVNAPINFPVSTKGITLSLFIWEGDMVTDEPGTPQYTFTKNLPSGTTTNLFIDIAPYIRDFFDNRPITTFTATQLEDSLDGNIFWVKWVVVYDDQIETIADIVGIDFATDGYGYYTEGTNTDFGAKKILTSSLNVKVPNTGYYLIPIATTDQATATITGFPSGTPTQLTVSIIDETQEQVKYVAINMDDYSTFDYVTIEYLLQTIYIEPTEECVYSPITIDFLNKEGVWEEVTFFKKNTISISKTDKEFKNNTITAGTYDVEKPQYQKYNVESRESLDVNTGFVFEGYSETMKELMQSEHVYQRSGSTLIPVSVDSSSLTFKTRINDGLINYSISLKYAFDEISNI